MRERPAKLALVAETVRTHRLAAGVWIIDAGGFMYVMGLFLADEMAEFQGGAKAFADSLRPAAEALRLMRWPADRLDTLGGYLTYHNVMLYNLALGIYAAVQGARAVRGGEDNHSLEEVLATGQPRWAVLRDRALGFLVVLLLITAGVTVGVAAAMASGGEPDLAGSVITIGTSGLVGMVGYALGLFLSQLTGTSRAASGASALLLSTLYVLTNVWEQVGLLGVVRFVSPFHYANASRALVPGEGLDLSSTLALLAMTAVLLGLAAWAFEHRDYGAPLWARRRTSPVAGPARVQRPMLRRVWTAELLRTRVGLVAWPLGAAAGTLLLAVLQPTVMDLWAELEFIPDVAGGGTQASATAQYLSFSADLVTPVIAAYVIAQAAGWVEDLAQGRVEMVLAAPVSWARLVWERILAATVGVAAITLGALGGLVVGALAVGAELEAGGLARSFLDCLLLGAALAGVAALVVAATRDTIAVTVLATLVAASYLLGLLAPLFGWSGWVNRLSVFAAFGHPYLEWPSLISTLVLLVLAVPGGLLAALLASRTPKVG